MRVVLAIFFHIVPLIGIGQTIINAGNVTGKWTKSGSPYKVKGNILIPSNSTLRIEAGVIVEFKGYYTLEVEGNLIAIGSRTDSIKFICFENNYFIRYQHSKNN